MNIFVLDTDPSLAAQYHCDKHVVKMILESAQMLSTALGQGYRPTHPNHPCTLWVKQSRENAEWLIQLVSFLNIEWQLRYKHADCHKSYKLIISIRKRLDVLPSNGLTPFALAMPDEYKQADPVAAYRAYYHTKRDIATWLNGAPYWWTE